MNANKIRQLFRIQYVSDLHLEFYNKISFRSCVKPVAPYLALAGDIGKPGTNMYTNFLSYVSSNWEHVFYVAGNHEYYDTPRSKWNKKKPVTFEERHQEIINITREYPNIHFFGV